MQRIPVLLSGFMPVSLDRCPVLALSCLIRFAVLGNDGGHAPRMRDSKTPAYPGAVVVNPYKLLRLPVLLAAGRSSVSRIPSDFLINSLWKSRIVNSHVVS